MWVALINRDASPRDLYITALIQGCGSNRILDFNAQIQHLMQEKEYAQALAMYDTHLSLDNSNKGHQRGLLKAMQEANFDHTLEQYQKNCCLSLQDWDSDLNEVKELLLKRKTEEFDEKIKTMSLDVKLDQGMDYSYTVNPRLEVDL